MLNKKNILCTVAASLAGLWVANASAANEGFYIGGQAGVGSTHQPGISSYEKSEAQGFLDMVSPYNSLTTSSFTTGLAGRLFAGYQLNQNWAAELGYTKFHDAESKLSGGAVSGYGTSLVDLNQKNTTKSNAVDLVVKAMMPLSNGFGIYGKLGAAYINQETTSDTSATFFDGETIDYSYAQKEHTIYPTFGAGVTYSLTQNVDTDLSWSRIQKVGDKSSIPSTDFVGLGLTYHFG